MTGYNKNNGDYASGNTLLLRDILKSAWGYPRWVISYWSDPQLGIRPSGTRSREWYLGRRDPLALTAVREPSGRLTLLANCRKNVSLTRDAHPALDVCNSYRRLGTTSEVDMEHIMRSPSTRVPMSVIAGLPKPGRDLSTLWATASLIPVLTTAISRSAVARPSRRHSPL